MKQLIRLVRSTDVAAIQAIYAPYVEQTAISFEVVSPTVAEMHERIEHILPHYPWLVSCDSDDRVIGYAYASQHRSRLAYQWSVDVSAYIHPHYQRKGIGRVLYTELFALLRQQNFYNAYAGIMLPNAASVALHEAMGLRFIGLYENVGYKQGAWHNVGWWGGALQEHATEPLPPKPLSEVIDFSSWSQLHV